MKSFYALTLTGGLLLASFAWVTPSRAAGEPGRSAPVIGISLQAALAMALAQSPDIALSEANARIAGYRVVSSKGPFDLTLTLVPAYTSSVTPAISPFAAGPNGGPSSQQTQSLGLGLSQRLFDGSLLSLTSSAQQTQSNSTANAYNPYDTTSLALTLMKPLGRGRFTDDRRDLELNIVAAESARATAIETLQTTMTAVIDTYWDLVAAWRHLAIDQTAVQQAESQVSSNGRLVHRGQAAPVDVVEADTQVDVDRDAIAADTATVASLENRLKGLILAHPNDPLWEAHLLPTSPLAQSSADVDFRHLIVAGLLQRPEFAVIRAARRNAEVLLTHARDAARPQLDLNLGIVENGFAGESGNLAANPVFTGFAPLYTSVNTLIAQSNAALPPNATPLAPVSAIAITNPPGTIGRFGTAWNSLFQGEYPTYTAQLSLGLPLQHDRARGERGIAEESLRSVDIQEAQAIEHLIVDARNAIESYRAAQARLVAAHAAQVAAQRVLESEQRRFEVGRSTTFLVVQREIAAEQDQAREVEAESAVSKAGAELDRVSGDLLVHNGIHLATSAAAVHHLFERAGIPEPTNTL